ncbi:Serine/threonine-protein kinase HT1 [Leucoagaricus sp. SymC.cos]|nr:Serine/threonine-protein kinase HT1 [Leucoagaricus sp. SymC.cos]
MSSPKAISGYLSPQKVVPGARGPVRAERSSSTAGSSESSDKTLVPPKCHPRTRENLRSLISEWRKGLSKHRAHSVWWLLGPPGTGKSAIASTAVAEARRDKQPCAAYFFGHSSSNHPLDVIPSLSDQLRKQIPAYDHLVEERLSVDRSILRKIIHTQFRELIAEPLQSLHSQTPFSHPIVIILDGIDQCPENNNQRDFVRLLDNHCGSQTKMNVPLLWIVISRPEWHLKQMLDYGGIRNKCDRYHVVNDEEETLQQDVYTVIEDGFEDIKRKFSDVVPKDWPSKAYIRKLTESSTPLFSVAVSALQFIGSEERHDPVVGLETYLDFVCMASDSTASIAAPLRSFQATDSLYITMLKGVPNEHLSNLMNILCLRASYTGGNLSACLEANILHLDQSSFYAALDEMHSILRIPPPDQATEKGMIFYHSSFLDFLKDPERSGKFASEFKDSYSEVALTTLQWYDILLTSDINNASRLEWRPETDTEFLFDGIRNVVSEVAWSVCCQTTGDGAQKVLETLSHFDSQRLERFVENERRLIPFLNWLHENDSHEGVLRPRSAGLRSRLLFWRATRSSPVSFPLRVERCKIVEHVSISSEGKISSKPKHSADFRIGSRTNGCYVRIQHDLPAYPASKESLVGFISVLQERVLGSEERYKALLQKTGAEAQQILDILDAVLSSPLNVVSDAVRPRIVKTLSRLSTSSRRYPRQLILQGIETENSELGRGGYGVVFKGTYKGNQICVKTGKSPGSDKKRNETMVKVFLREAVLWSHLIHPNVLPLYGIFQPNNQSAIGLVSPWMANGNMSDFLNQSPNTPRMPLIHDVLAGLKYLHQHHVVHGDLKGLNILIDGGGTAYLADFGLSTLIQIDPIGTASTQPGGKGTYRWMAPELLEENSKRPDFHSDIYSISSVMLEAFTGKIPFHGLTEVILFRRLSDPSQYKPDRPDETAAPELTDGIWRIMQDCWIKDPAERLKVGQIIERLAGLGFSPSPRATTASRSKVPTRTGTIYDSDIMFVKDTLGILKPDHPTNALRV